MEEGLCVLDRGGIIRACNDAFGALLGRRSEPLPLGRRFSEVCQGELLTLCEEAHRRIFESQSPSSLRSESVGVLAFPIHRIGGEVFCLLLLFTGEELTPPWQRFSPLAPPAIFFQDALGNIVAVSASFAETFHRKEESFTFYQDVTAYISPVEVSRARRDFIRLTRGESILGEHYILRQADGTPLFATVAAFPLYGEGKEFFGVTGCVFPARVESFDPSSTLDEVLISLRSIERKLSALSRRDSPSPPPRPFLLFLEKLSSREVEVLRFLAEGYSVGETARLLGISPNTVETHRRSIMRKLNLSSMARLVRAAVFFGLVSEDPWR